MSFVCVSKASPAYHSPASRCKALWALSRNAPPTCCQLEVGAGQGGHNLPQAAIARIHWLPPRIGCQKGTAFLPTAAVSRRAPGRRFRRDAGRAPWPASGRCGRLDGRHSGSGGGGMPGAPGAAEGFFPEKLEGADGLGGSLAGQFPFGFEMEEVLAKFLGAEEVGRLAKELAQLAHAGPVAEDGAFGQGQEAEVVEEAI